ncbi:uncharacterized protein LOC123927169 isoform X4 [Meles meles]|nr:uncharacterized protein LOC123927169 isoform X4 [Meles meles]
MEHQYQPTYVGCLGSEVKDNGRRGTEAILLSRILSLALQEQPSNKLATLVRQLQRAWKGLLKKGVVPYLGTFLTDLFMLETAMEDYLKLRPVLPAEHKCQDNWPQPTSSLPHCQ